MQRAGLATAKLALAIAPHAKVIWIPCGPGNNGGDGFEAAAYLKAWGKSPVVTCLNTSLQAPSDAAASQHNAIQAGVTFTDQPPTHYDLCIDALFGIGRILPLDKIGTAWIRRINSYSAPVLAVDVPSGLDADTGVTYDLYVRAQYTLCLLTLKPGLFTADGRDACGEIWFNNLGVGDPTQSCAILTGQPPTPVRPHNTHKGSYGDVCVIGGAQGMTGAALLAARAALLGGAGRVYVGMLDTLTTRLDQCQPELMFRSPAEINLAAMAVVAGCGGGDAIRSHMPQVLQQSGRLVLDADALNAIAADATLQAALRGRPPNTTILTPHPLEAARLMKTSSAEIQADRIRMAQTMADHFACVVVLKGSGTIIAAPGVLPHINPTGNARLATAGTGDVLAGLIGARLASGTNPFSCACESAFRHGQVAQEWPQTATMTAENLARAL